uniref:Uncharacterized protein n=2 Tax=unclassified Caudoviricetes TaxID=2788787 RepID=A0A8S5NWY7_9CAUD|nr:MAG TPA: hypothetical protein [Myoviridae sp. ctzUB9]DAE07659.1 MAG TPA: hypothetical protein [Myoviridae sp. ctIyl4]
MSRKQQNQSFPMSGKIGFLMRVKSRLGSLKR